MQLGPLTRLLLPPCCHEDIRLPGKWLKRPKLYGVPGQVRTANLPLRRAGAVITPWIELLESGEVGGSVRGALETISKNEAFISMTLAVLMTPE